MKSGILLLVAAVALTLSGCGGSSSDSQSPADVMKRQHLTGCTAVHDDSQIELFASKEWDCDQGSFLWFNTPAAQANWKKVADQFGGAKKSGSGWAID